MALLGLWIIMAGAMAAAVVGGVGEYAWKRYRKHEDVEHMRHRLSMFLSSAGRRDRSRLQAAEAAVAAEGDAHPDRFGPTPFMHGPKAGSESRWSDQMRQRHASGADM